MLVSGRVFLPLNPQTHWEKWKILIPRNGGETCIYRCFLKWWYLQIIYFNRVFHYKPSILGYPYFWKHPYIFSSWHHYCKGGAFGHTFWTARWTQGCEGKKTCRQVENDQLLRMYCNSKTCVYIYIYYIYVYVYIYIQYIQYIYIKQILVGQIMNQ